MTVGIRYVDGPRPARSLYAASDWVAAGRDAINRINVFPVPDGDTGTNFSLTLRTVVDALRALGDSSLSETAHTAALDAMLGASGNFGMRLAHFLLGFTAAIDGREQISAQEVALGVRQGAERLYASRDDLREGTILTVAREAAVAAEGAANDSPDISLFVAQMLAEGELSLTRTPELMAVLKPAGVVDAGGMGVVRMIESVLRLNDGDPILPGAPFTGRTEAMIPNFAGSVQAVVAADVLRIHVHTDTPEAVFTYAVRWDTVDASKAEDMRAQHRRLGHNDRRPIAIVADSSGDLPDAVLDRRHIALMPLQGMFGDVTFRDRVELKPEDFYRSTAAPPPSGSACGRCGRQSWQSRADRKARNECGRR